MDDRQLRRRAEKAVRDVVKLAESYQSIGKEQFEAILGRVIEHVSNDTGTPPKQVAEKTEKVVKDMPHEYGSLPADVRLWESLAAYLYGKYLKELGSL
jgi:hypothetical protein